MSSTSVAPGCRVFNVQLVKGASTVEFGRMHLATPVPVSAAYTVFASEESVNPASFAPENESKDVHVIVSPGTGSAGDGA